MRFSMKALLLIAVAVGFTVAITAPAMATFPNFDNNNMIDTPQLLYNGDATGMESGVINGVASDTSDSILPGALFVGYYRTNGTHTSARERTTQDTRATSDSVMGVPAATIITRLIIDNDSKVRQVIAGGFPGWVSGFFDAANPSHGSETYPRKVPPESGDTFALEDSVPWIMIELKDTGIAVLQIINTSNYACTMQVMLHMPDTEFRANRLGSYKEKDSRVIVKFYSSLCGDSVNTTNGCAAIRDSGDVPIIDTIPERGTVKLAEDAETFIYFRVYSGPLANARDSLAVTIVMYPDSCPDSAAYNYTDTRYRRVRIFDDTGYRGDNDSNYAKGGSEDSVSLFVLVATAIVRVKKTDSVFAPYSYMDAIGLSGNRDGSNRSHDTIPGARICYTIVYDNDGNRRADSLEIQDYLPGNVDLLVDSYYNGTDTYYANGIGVDTRWGHARYKQNGQAASEWPEDIFAQVLFSSLTAADSQLFSIQATPFVGRCIADSVVDSVAGIRIRWPAGDSMSLQRDQIDDEYSTGNWMDPLSTVDGLTFGANAQSTDSGDCGKISFAVVIR